MTRSDELFAAGTRKLALMQLAIGGFGALAFAATGGIEAGKAAIFGAFISLVLGRLLSWGVERASRAAAENNNKGVAVLYIGAAQRFLLAIALFAIGMAVLKLPAFPMVVGFGLAQAAYFVFNRMLQRTAERTS